ncbi:hypothetical protein GCM10023175_18080 [Pseudonocardia xishanensis]|uniref:Uncharacterized protein n=1 Tax=Pseudonocardia xishanensis TaxID=630995 RepID=A0ABP8RMH1_9PSEU
MRHLPLGRRHDGATIGMVPGRTFAESGLRPAAATTARKPDRKSWARSRVGATANTTSAVRAATAWNVPDAPAAQVSRSSTTVSRNSAARS